MLYIGCTVISYDYIDSKHNMIEIQEEIRKPPDKRTKKSKRSWDSTWDEWRGSYKRCTDMKQETLEIR